MIFNRKIDETAAVRKKKISLHFSGGRFHFPRNSSQRCCCYSPSWISSVASSWEGGGNFHQSEHVQGAAGHSKLFVNWYNAENERERAADSVFERHLTSETRTFVKLWQNFKKWKKSGIIVTIYIETSQVTVNPVLLLLSFKMLQNIHSFLDICSGKKVKDGKYFEEVNDKAAKERSKHQSTESIVFEKF